MENVIRCVDVSIPWKPPQLRQLEHHRTASVIVVIVALIVGAAIGVVKGEGIGGILVEALTSAVIAGAMFVAAGTMNKGHRDGTGDGAGRPDGSRAG